MTTISRLVFALAVLSSVAGYAGADELAVESYVEAMVGAVRLIPLPCTLPFETLAPDEKVVCLGPYWSFREFRALWDQTATDPNFVPVVPEVLSGWSSKSGVYERRYAVAGYSVRVVFENKTDKSAIFYQQASRAAALAAAAELPAEAPGGDFDSPPPSAAGPAVAGVAAAAAATPTGATPTTGTETTATRTEPPPAETAPVGAETAGTPAATAPAPAQAPMESSFVPPAVIPASRVEPMYPFKARIARMAARVVLDVVVHRDGRLGEVTVLSCDKPGYGFEDAAIRAVRRWRFTAALRDGRPVEASTAVVLNFTPGG